MKNATQQTMQNQNAHPNAPKRTAGKGLRVDSATAGDDLRAGRWVSTTHGYWQYWID